MNLDNIPLKCKKKPVEVLTRDMRADFQGFLANAEGRGKGLQDLVGDDSKAPAYRQSIGARIGAPPAVSSSVSQDKLREAQEKLRKASSLLLGNGVKIREALSEKTQEKLKTAAPEDRPKLFAQDETLTAEKMHDLICNGSIKEALELVKEVAELLKDDPAFAVTFSSLYAQLATWFRGPLEEVLRGTPEGSSRQDLLDLLTYFRKAGS